MQEIFIKLVNSLQIVKITAVYERNQLCELLCHLSSILRQALYHPVHRT